MDMQRVQILIRLSAFYAAHLSMASMAQAASMPFAQFPAESAFRLPAPNLIVSVDNALSMETQDVAAASVGLKDTAAGSSPISRQQALKQILAELFSADQLPDDSVRLAYQSTHGCDALPASSRAISPACVRNQHSNRMAALRGRGEANEASTRAAFLRWVRELPTGTGLSAQSLVLQAGEYLMQSDAESPWSDQPGTAQATSQQKSCRRAYHLLFTDGTTPAKPQDLQPPAKAISTLPDGTAFDPASNPQLQIYAAASKAASPSTWALRYWATDLQPALPNGLTPEMRRTEDEIQASADRRLALSPYWNPRNDPATWQHMVQFTVNLGAGSDSADPPLPRFDPARGTWSGADYQRLLLGSMPWPDPHQSASAMRQDLWHAAINSRGQHFQIGGSLDQLRRAVSGIVAQVSAGSGRTISGYASDGQSTSYTAVYEASSWSGYVLSNRLPDASGDASPNPDWGTLATRPLQPQRTTADHLDALSDADIDRRLVLSHDGDRGVPFRWDALSAAQQAQLQSPDLLRFLRGERSMEAPQQSDGFRTRRSRQGDIVNSRLWHVGAPANGHADKSYRDFANRLATRMPMLYVGGNDGMLHGFSAATGEEVLAYVPRGVIRHLPQLAEPSYRHRYFVDGSPFTGDVLLGSASNPQWKTLLVGTLGAGGPGYFVLDVTTPSAPRNPASGNFTEANAGDLVVMDRTDGSDPDVGHIFAVPTLDEANARRTLQITRTNNQRWAAILGNGYGSANGQPVLLVQYLDGARELLKIPAVAQSTGGKGASNGLSAPQFLDVNADGIPDFVYAGDLAGQLWKFDISAASDQRWRALGNGAPLFTAKRNGRAQPITTAPVLRVHPEIGALMLAFGTGQNLTEADAGDASVQSVYGIMDYARYVIQDSGADKGKVAIDTDRRNLPTVAQSREDLMPQGVQQGAGTSGSGTSAHKTFWQLQGTPFTYCTKTPCATGEKKGWYLDLPAERERVLDPLAFYGSGQILEIISRVPPTTATGATNGLPEEACEHDPRPGQTYRTLLSITAGTPPRSRTMDTDGDGRYTDSDAPASRTTAASRELRLTSIQRSGITVRKGSDGSSEPLRALPTRVARPSWRHLK